MSGSEYAPPSGSGGVVWRNTRCVSSSKLHAYRDGKAICGSPLAPGAGVVIHEIPPLIIGCKKCRELCQNAHALAEERSDDSQQRVVGGKVDR